MIHQWLSFAIPTGQSSTKYNNIFIVEHTPHHTQRGKEFWKRHWAASFSNASSNTEWVFFVTIAILFVFRFRESWKTQAVFVVFGRFSILPHMYPNLQLNPGNSAFRSSGIDVSNVTTIPKCALDGRCRDTERCESQKSGR